MGSVVTVSPLVFLMNAIGRERKKRKKRNVHIRCRKGKINGCKKNTIMLPLLQVACWAGRIPTIVNHILGMPIVPIFHPLIGSIGL